MHHVSLHLRHVLKVLLVIDSFCCDAAAAVEVSKNGGAGKGERGGHAAAELKEAQTASIVVQ